MEEGEGGGEGGIKKHREQKSCRIGVEKQEEEVHEVWKWQLIGMMLVVE